MNDCLFRYECCRQALYSRARECLDTKIMRSRSRPLSFIAQITWVELSSVIYKKTTSGSPPPRLRMIHADKMLALFRRQIRLRAYHEVRLTRAVLQRAAELIRAHQGLRSLDAIQLASALVVRDNAIASGTALSLFITADSKLLRIASAEGLATDNPENY